MNQSESRFT